MTRRTKHSILQCLLGKPFFIAYFFLGIIFFALAPCLVPGSSLNDSFFVTLALMTGSDPYSVEPPLPLKQTQALWCLSWLIHVTSWLLIPALIGVVINDAAEELKEVQDLHTAIGGVVAELKSHWGLSSKEVDDLQKQIIDLIDTEMERPERKESKE